MKSYMPATALLVLLAIPASAAPIAYQSAAPIAYMIDLSSGAVLFAQNADKPMPPASMAKMMTSHVAFDLIKQGKLRLDQKFTVRPETWAKWHGPEAGSTMFLKSGDQVSVENLLKGIITLSGNDACVVLAEGIAGTEASFVALMNVEAKKLGMKNTQFGTSNGWPDNGRTFTTARDLGLLGASTIQNYPNFYKAFYGLPAFSWGDSVGGGTITQPNRNPILGKIAGADGMKTGHTAEAGFGFVGSAIQNSRRIVMVVAGLPTYGNRITESVRFIDWGFKNWKSTKIANFNAAKPIGEAEVQLGSQSTVSLVAPSGVFVTHPIDGNLSYGVSIAYMGPVRAPIKKGQHVADLVIKTASTEPQITPLLAGEDVNEAGFFRRAWLGFLSIFGL
jgi:serine-type D-Ala-D-Ala carboxypeptidase (penicillin-binding protein 5/6)